MKKIVSGILLYGSISMLGASEVNCSITPVGMELAKAIEAKEIKQAKSLLAAFKEDVANYLKKCDNSQAKQEETSVMVLTYEDRLSDMESDLKNKTTVKTDCSNVPDTKALDKAFKEGDFNKIKTVYANYKKEAEGYLSDCASHEEYETVFEASLLYEESYATWEKNAK